MNPEEFPAYDLELVASPADVDELGHVVNVAYVRWVLDAAKAHSWAVGLDFAAYRRAGGFFVVQRHDIKYLRSAMPGDRIRVTTKIEALRAASSTRHTTITRVSDGAELAEAHTWWVFVTADLARPQRIPVEIRERFRSPPWQGQPGLGLAAQAARQVVGIDPRLWKPRALARVIAGARQVGAMSRFARGLARGLLPRA